VYLPVVAPPIAPQLAPPESQRSHWKEKRVGPFVHEPLLAVRTLPTLALPEMAGADVFDGGAFPSTGPTALLSFWAQPSALQAVTTLIIACPVSARTSR
jgi:hypothetical protein